MIMRIRGFDLEIEVTENSKTVLTILNKPLYRKLVMDFQLLLENEDNNNIVIEDNNKILNYDKEVVLMTDYYNIDFENKPLVNVLYKKLEDMVVLNSDYHTDLEILYKKLSQHMHSILLDCEVDLSCKSDLDLIGLFKFLDVNVSIQNKMNSLENIYSYLDLLAYMQTKKLLIFFNLKSNFTLDEITNLYKYAEYKKVQWLCIENDNYDKLDFEQSYIIDEDLIEFNYTK